MTAKQPFDIGPAPDFQRGDRVTITLPGIAPWTGVVTAIKPSSESGWWLDIRDDRDGMTQQCQADIVVLLSRETEEEQAETDALFANMFPDGDQMEIEGGELELEMES